MILVVLLVLFVLMLELDMDKLGGLIFLLIVVVSLLMLVLLFAVIGMLVSFVMFEFGVGVGVGVGEKELLVPDERASATSAATGTVASLSCTFTIGWGRKSEHSRTRILNTRFKSVERNKHTFECQNNNKKLFACFHVDELETGTQNIISNSY